MKRRFLSDMFVAGVVALGAISAACTGSSMAPSELNVMALAPSAGPLEGNVQVTINGTGFQQGATVSFGDVPTNAVVRNDRTVVADAPAHTEGAVDVVVRNPDGGTSVLKSGYTYTTQRNPGASIFLPDVTLSGVVYEVDADSLQRIGTIEGVAVYCEPCTQDTHAFVYTDSNGAYTFSGVWTEGRPAFPTRLLVSMAGYSDPPGVPTPTPPNPSGAGWREVVINGRNTSFDIELVRR